MNACFTCQHLKVVQATPRAPLQPIETGYPNQRLGIDFMGPFTQTRNGNRCLLVIVEFFTKWVEVAALPLQETIITANAIFSEWVTRYGVPDQIHSDQGPNFESRLFHEPCEASGVKKTRTTPYHPQGNGQTERTNQSLLSLLKSFIDQAKHDCWCELLPQCLIPHFNKLIKYKTVATATLYHARPPSGSNGANGQGYNPA